MLKFFTLFLSAILSFGSLHPTELNEEEENKETLVVYTNAEFAPFEYVCNSEIVGIDIDICQRIADELDRELVVVNTSFDSIIGAIASGKGDIGASGFTITDERKEMVSFSIPYYDTTQYIVVPKGSDIKSVQDLKGKRIVVQYGSSGDLYITDMDLEETEIIRFNSANEGAWGLGTKYDALIIDELAAKSIASLHGFDTVLIDDIETEQYGLAINKADTDILEAANKVIAEMIEDGSLVESLSYHVEASKAAE